MRTALLQKARTGRSIALASLVHRADRTESNIVSLERARQRRQDMICLFVSRRAAGIRTDREKIAYAA